MYQHITLIGNLGRDPEMRYTPSGSPVSNLSLATNRTYKGADGNQVKETCWFRVSVFGKTAETAAQYLHKGSLVLVEGHLRPDAQTGGPRIYDRQDGTKGASYELFATNVRFMPSGQRGEGGPAAVPEDVPGAPTETMGDEEIPF